jgi:hypothetical protein
MKPATISRSLYLLIEGGSNKWSLDALLARKPKGELS